MYYFKFQVMGLPKTTNAQNSMHWTQKGKYVKEWHQTISSAVGFNKPASPLKKAKLILTRFSSFRPDYDGLVSSFKSVTDALIVCGIIEDDNMDVIGVPEFHWIKAKQKEGKIQVEIIGNEDK